jgi:moderate conductance mechanosensitive channel
VSTDNCWSEASGNDLCRLVHQVTGSEQLARASDWLIAKPTSIILLIVIGFVVRWVLHRLINRLTKRAATGTAPDVFQHGTAAKAREMFLEATTLSAERRQQRAEALASMLRSITTGVVFSIVAFMAFAQLGYDIAPLIASAGIIGVALGFGAQSLVKDFLSGICMILEDQFGVGDAVDVGAAAGTIESVGLRITRLRDVNGTVWYVRNGEILRVANLSQSWARTVLEISVGFSADLDRVQDILHEATGSVWEDAELRRFILEEPEVSGVDRWEADGVVVQVVVKTSPEEQPLVAREMRERIMARLAAEGIETPLPQRVVWHRYEEAGSTD